MKFFACLAGLALVSASLLANAQNAVGDQVKRGQYLATAADCIACHTVDAKKPFAGGYAIATPFGTIYGPNITPDKATGIGNWSDDEFVRALHEGIGKHGEHLYPAFPYTSFTKLSRDDVLAIKAYLFSLPAINQQTPANPLSFPFNQRAILWGWKLFNFTPGRMPDNTDPARAQVHRGAYLAEALAHCQECHTPRNLTMGVDKKLGYGGANLAGWKAFNITSDPISGVGAWSDAELGQYLQTGVVAGKASAAGGMAEAIEHSLRYLTADDIAALVLYLRGVPAIRDSGDSKPRFAYGTQASDEIDLRGVAGVIASSDASSPQELFSGHCASCHSASGGGSADNFYPSLMNNSVLGSRDPSNLVMVMLHGVSRAGKDGDTFMPPFADRLNDVQIASLSNYLLKQFGNDQARVDAAFVAQQRAGGPPSPLPKLMLAGAIGGALVLLLLIVWLRRRRRRRV